MRALLAKLKSLFDAVPLVDGDPTDEIEENFPMPHPVENCGCSICRFAMELTNAN